VDRCVGERDGRLFVDAAQRLSKALELGRDFRPIQRRGRRLDDQRYGGCEMRWNETGMLSQSRSAWFG